MISCSLRRALLLFAGALLSAGLSWAADPDKPKPLRYLRPHGDKLVLESEISETRSKEGAIYTSLTDRGPEKMTLTLHFDKERRVQRAEAVQQDAKGKRRAEVVFEGNTAQLRRGDATTRINDIGDPIVTTAPDWTDIFQLVRKYDGDKGGRQEFTGLWIHPVKDHLVLKFRIERLGTDTISPQLSLDRYRIRLRSGDYLVWADANRRVYKLFPAGQPKAFVALEGFEEATKKLSAPK